MGIDVLDHIIIGDKNYQSLKRGGLLEQIINKTARRWFLQIEGPSIA